MPKIRKEIQDIRSMPTEKRRRLEYAVVAAHNKEFDRLQKKHPKDLYRKRKDRAYDIRYKIPLKPIADKFGLTVSQVSYILSKY